MGGMRRYDDDYATAITSAAISGGWRHYESLKTWANGHGDEEMPDDLAVVFSVQIESQTLGREVWVLCMRQAVDEHTDIIVPLAIIDEQLIDGLVAPEGVMEHQWNV